MDAQILHTYLCPTCGEENEIMIDLSAGSRQQYVEDCSVCCSPNSLRILVGREPAETSIEAEPES